MGRRGDEFEGKTGGPRILDYDEQGKLRPYPVKGGGGGSGIGCLVLMVAVTSAAIASFSAIALTIVALIR
jgi:hypothetical protein